ncbi:SDR family NAD(P)-dependent oxidoreductase [Nonlabens ponticola]|uniref:SDR family oxidoreductase n=1 Tax=Nonlabens ponticola TaxID=2496866 RepID=A0A3S9MUB7_9FLAO|nr:SDR family oxidoreductase [Nonlabens ponticola]AZQ42772.1 SDR family oxidoreductase [Nonlabens ponticola]
MDLQLSGKTALVTGSTKGIGKAIAKQLLKEGAKVIIHGSSQKSVDKAMSDLGSFPGATGMPCDVGNENEINDFIKDLPEIDILVNNLGIFEQKDFAEIKDDEWIKFFEINVLSGIRFSRALFPKMLEKNNHGRVIFISSESALNIPEDMIQYGMTKTAQLAISRGLANLTKGTTVTVNSVLPGPTYSDGIEDFLDSMNGGDHDRDEIQSEFFNNARPSSLLQRFIEPEEIANLVAFVASPLSIATNGASLRAEGGIVNSI